MHDVALLKNDCCRDARQGRLLQCMVYPQERYHLSYRRAQNTRALRFWQQLFDAALPRCYADVPAPAAERWTLDCDWDGNELLGLILREDWPLMFFAIVTEPKGSAECWSTLMRWITLTPTPPPRTPWMLMLPFADFLHSGTEEREYLGAMVEHLAWAFYECDKPARLTGESLEERLAVLTGYAEEPLALNGLQTSGETLQGALTIARR